MINWKLRLQNKTTLLTLVVAVVSCVYSVLAALGVAPSVSQDMVMDLASALVAILCALGIVVDPTTEGVKDSARALEYTEPNKGVE